VPSSEKIKEPLGGFLTTTQALANASLFGHNRIRGSAEHLPCGGLGGLVASSRIQMSVSI
jgi:hypothetical protein